jgi:alanyl-tRNA synthetase
MSTQRLYYNDSYILSFEAEVIEHTTHGKHPALILDRTYFYPEGGGQPADTGTLNGVRVLDVQARAADNAVLHILERELADSRVEGHIDRARRLDHMQHHTGQHVLSQALERAGAADTLSVHMSSESMTIDVNRTEIELETWIAVEDLANQIVLEDRPVRAWFPEADELAALRLRKMPEVAGSVRVVDVGGFDITACGGTHVARTGEIGLIKIVKTERRGNTTRIEFRCGGRALRDYRDKHDIVSRLAAHMTVGGADLFDSVVRIQAENKALRADVRAAREQLAETEAIVMLSSAPLHSDRRVVVRAFDGRSPDEVRLLAQKIIGQPGSVALLGTAGERAQLIFGRSADLPLDIVPVLRHALATLGVERGGGRPDFAQGGGVTASLAQVEAALRQAEHMVR